MEGEPDGVQYWASVRKAYGDPPEDLDAERNTDGEAVYLQTGVVPHHQPIWVGRSADIDLGQFPQDGGERFAFELRFYGDSMTVRQGAGPIGQTRVVSDSLAPGTDGALVPWSGKRDLLTHEPTEGFKSHPKVSVLWPFLELETGLLGCHVSIHYLAVSLASTSQAAPTQPASTPTPEIIHLGDLSNQWGKRWPHLSTLHFMIAMSAIDATDPTASDRERAAILDRLVQLGHVKLRIEHWDAAKIADQQKGDRRRWGDAGCSSFDAYAARLGLPAHLLGGVYRKAIEVTAAYVAEPWP
jgi:hypothetical protein